MHNACGEVVCTFAGGVDASVVAAVTAAAAVGTSSGALASLSAFCCQASASGRLINVVCLISGAFSFFGRSFISERDASSCAAAAAAVAVLYAGDVQPDERLGVFSFPH